MAGGGPSAATVRLQRVTRAARQLSLAALARLGLTLALLPAGLFAVWLGWSLFQHVRDLERAEFVGRADALAAATGTRFRQDTTTLRALLIATSGTDSAACTRALNAVGARNPQLMLIAKFDAQGRLLCGSRTAPITSSAISAGTDGDLVEARGGQVRVAVTDGQETVVATAEPPLLPADGERARAASAALVGADGALLEAHGPDGAALARYYRLGADTGTVTTLPGRARIVIVERPLGSSGPRLVVAQPTAPVTPMLVATAVLPAAMWLLAIGVAGFLISRYVVTPISALRTAISRYSSGGAVVPAAGARGRSVEMTALGAAFEDLTGRIGREQDAQAAALVEQQRLAREVHHRVKNNLQIITSLLSIQAREATSADVEAAYRSIQRRVNALALVHRWMYEGQAGEVALKPLVADICVAFEGTRDASGRAITIRHDCDAAMVAQDTAVPVAFLLTELLTASERLDGTSDPTIAVTARLDGRSVTLTLTSPLYAERDLFGPESTEATARIARGMARQLRGNLAYNPDGGYSIRIARVVPAE